MFFFFPLHIVAIRHKEFFFFFEILFLISENSHFKVHFCPCPICSILWIYSSKNDRDCSNPKRSILLVSILLSLYLCIKKGWLIRKAFKSILSRKSWDKMLFLSLAGLQTKYSIGSRYTFFFKLQHS